MAPAMILAEVAMRDLLSWLSRAFREIAEAPLEWNGYQMAGLVVAAFVVFLLAMLLTGGTPSG